MKRSLSCAIASFAILSLLTGCTKQYVTEEHYIIKGDSFSTQYIVADKHDWRINGEAGYEDCYLYQTFDVSEIDGKVMEDGAVLVYLVDADNRDNILPLMRPYDDVIPFVYENIRYDVEVGELTVIIESSDFSYVVPEGDYSFKVVIMSHAD